MPRLTTSSSIALLATVALAAACGSDDTDDTLTVEVSSTDDAASPVGTAAPTPTPDTDTVDATTAAGDADTTVSAVDESTAVGEPGSYEIEVWADNWMAVYVDGELVGEDSVPITTERSFNAETFTFQATPPFTVAIEAKDFKETDSGIEYIGLQNQQMGDGGLIAQITDLSTGEVVSSTDATWASLVIHQAPLNTECERDPDPDATCEFVSVDAPDGWTTAGFDDASWSPATIWSEADVSPKDGYDEISWESAAQLVWGSDLEVDNTVLFRTVVT